jgi:2-dehydro-3-deoxyphosphogluconate aldolase / (4S)-4-hydroxy-2-oxoglutarate aldolase
MSSRDDSLMQIVKTSPVIPVITIADADDAVPLARALLNGGIATIEIALRTPAAVEAARAVIAEVPEMSVGIGTVLTPQSLADAKAMGARYALSPGATPELLEAAAGGDFPYIPGVATASDVMAAVVSGFSVLKFFPAENAGGIAGLRALAGPFPAIRFCPTGGINEKNFRTWLAEPNVVAVGGSWLAPAADIAAGRWDAITARAKEAATRAA